MGQRSRALKSPRLEHAQKLVRCGREGRMARFLPLAHDRARTYLTRSTIRVAGLGDCIFLYISRNETQPYFNY